MLLGHEDGVASAWVGNAFMVRTFLKEGKLAEIAELWGLS